MPSTLPPPRPETTVPPVDPRHIRLAHRAFIHARIAGYRARRVGRSDSGWRGTRILLYHRITDEQGDPLAIHPDTLRRQLDLIRRRPDLEFVSIREMYDTFQDPDDDRRRVAVSLDDGYLDALTVGLGIFREFEAPATVFLPTAIIDRRQPCTWYGPKPPPFMTWDDVQALTADGLVDVQPHGERHLALPTLTPEEVAHEITNSITELEGRTRTPAHSYSYAGGLFGVREQEIVRSTALRGAMSCIVGTNDHTTDRSALRRTAIFGYEGAAEFQAILNGALDRDSIVRRVRSRRRPRAT